VGVSPKLFARIARFEAALDRMARLPQGSWTEVAHRFGYYDQMHMVHDFSRFTGETPTRTLQHFEATFEQQMTALRSGHAPAISRRAIGPLKQFLSLIGPGAAICPGAGLQASELCSPPCQFDPSIRAMLGFAARTPVPRRL
jgi:AraC-like DNA-binding protein